MVGRNFWVVETESGWEVRQEGLPNKTARHASREEAWAAACEAARGCHGDAFLADGQGGVAEEVSFRELPHKTKI